MYWDYMMHLRFFAGPASHAAGLFFYMLLSDLWPLRRSLYIEFRIVAEYTKNKIKHRQAQAEVEEAEGVVAVEVVTEEHNNLVVIARTLILNLYLFF
jgi:hypothetical protein